MKSVLTASYAPDVVTPPVEGHVIDPDIDRTGATDVTSDLSAWRTDIYNRFGEGTAAKPLKIYAPSGAVYQHNDQLVLAQQYEIWFTDPNNPAELRFTQTIPFHAQTVASKNPLGEIAPTWYEITGDFRGGTGYGWAGRVDGNVLTRLDPDSWTDIWGRPRTGLFSTSLVGQLCEVWWFNKGSTGYGKWEGTTSSSNEPSASTFTITAVSANRKSLTLSGTPHATEDPDFSATRRFWATSPRGAFENIFMPDPSWNRIELTGRDQSLGSAARRLANGGARRRPDNLLNMAAGNHIHFIDINIRGTNLSSTNTNMNTGYTDPIEVENVQLVFLGGKHNALGSSRQVSLSQLPVQKVHHGYGHGVRVEGSNTWMHDNAVYDVGRIGWVSSFFYGICIERCVLHSTHGAATDMEPTSTGGRAGTDNPYGGPTTGQWAADWWAYLDCIFGENPNFGHSDLLGGSSALPTTHGLLLRCTSLNAHVNAGLIPAVTPFRYATFGPTRHYTPEAGNVIIRDCETDTSSDNWRLRFGKNYLFESNDRRTKRNNTGAVEYDAALNYMSRLNTVNGVLDSGPEPGHQYHNTTPMPAGTFVEPGTVGSPASTGDWFFDRGGPVPPNYWRDL